MEEMGRNIRYFGTRWEFQAYKGQKRASNIECTAHYQNWIKEFAVKEQIQIHTIKVKLPIINDSEFTQATIDVLKALGAVNIRRTGDGEKYKWLSYSFKDISHPELVILSHIVARWSQMNQRALWDLLQNDKYRIKVLEALETPKTFLGFLWKPTGACVYFGSFLLTKKDGILPSWSAVREKYENNGSDLRTFNTFSTYCHV